MMAMEGVCFVELDVDEMRRRVMMAEIGGWLMLRGSRYTRNRTWNERGRTSTAVPVTRKENFVSKIRCIDTVTSLDHIRIGVINHDAIHLDPSLKRHVPPPAHLRKVCHATRAAPWGGRGGPTRVSFDVVYDTLAAGCRSCTMGWSR